MGPMSSDLGVAARAGGRALWGAVTLVLFAVFTVTPSGPAFGLWLPWSTAEQQIEKRSQDIFQALLRKDRKMLQYYVVGKNRDQFIAVELSQIRRRNIRDYDCEVRKATVDNVRGEYAWVDLKCTATLGNGQEFSRRLWKVFRKVGNDWKLYVHYSKDKKEEEEPQDDLFGGVIARTGQNRAKGVRSDGKVHDGQSPGTATSYGGKGEAAVSGGDFRATVKGSSDNQVDSKGQSRHSTQSKGSGHDG